MTVNYNTLVSNSDHGSLLKVLLVWRGSIWKACCFELFIWLGAYAIISGIYRGLLAEWQQRHFEQFALYLNSKLDYIPLNFMLGFFVTIVVNRWNVVLQNLGMVDNVALSVSTYIRGKGERVRMIRRNIVRYCCLSQVLVYRDISILVRKRFPTIDTVVAAGFMLPKELDKMEAMEYKYQKYWLPVEWALELAHRCRVLSEEEKGEGKKPDINADVFLTKITDDIKLFRSSLQTLFNLDWVPVPIMYPQIISLAVHSYFFICLIARQFLLPPSAIHIDIYFPIMTGMQLVFYFGWMKVAEALLNPFGEDDDDLEGNYLLDRNLAMALTAVDSEHDSLPDIEKDMFWLDSVVDPLYSEESVILRGREWQGSVATVQLPSSVRNVTMISKDDLNKEHLGVKNPLVRKVSVEVRRTHPMDESDNQSFIRNLRKRMSSGRSVQSHKTTSGNGNGHTSIEVTPPQGSPVRIPRTFTEQPIREESPTSLEMWTPVSSPACSPTPSADTIVACETEEEKEKEEKKKLARE